MRYFFDSRWGFSIKRKKKSLWLQNGGGGGPRDCSHRLFFFRLMEKTQRESKKFKKMVGWAPRGAARSHLREAQKEAPRCSHNRSAPKMSFPCLGCCKRKFFATPLEWEPRSGPRTPQAAVRSLVLEPEKPRLWLQCGACLLKTDTLAREVSQKKKVDNTSSARASVFSKMGSGSQEKPNSCKSVTGTPVRRILAQKNDSRA